MTILSKLVFVNADGEIEESKGSADSLEYLGLSTPGAAATTSNLLLGSGDATGAANDSGDVNIASGASALADRGSVSLDGFAVSLKAGTVEKMNVNATNISVATNMDFASTYKLTNLTNGTASSQDSCTVAQMETHVNGVAEGLSAKQAVRASSTVALVGAYAALAFTTTGDTLGENTIDGVALALGDRVLLQNQGTASQNGIYDVTTLADGAGQSLVLTRADDFNEATPINEISGAYVPVQEGTFHAGKYYVQSGTFATLDTDAINFVFFNSATTLLGGSGIDLTGTTFSIDLLASSGLQLTGAVGDEQLSVLLDNATLENNAGTIRVAADGIGENEIDLAAVDAQSFLATHTAINYIPSQVGAEGSLQVSSHIKGIDTELGSLASDIVAHANDLASVANAKGASLVGIEDAAGNFTAADVEAALAEVYTIASSGSAQSYAIAAAIDKGDLLVISVDDTVKEITIDAAGSEFGFALAETSEASGTVNAMHDSQVLTGIMAGMTAGQKIYYDSGVSGTARFSNSQTVANGSRVWQVGIAKNDTDLIIDINYIKKNAAA